MSNFLAIATVTAALRRALQASLDMDVPGATVGMARPDGNGGGTPSMGANIYLFQVTPNAAFRNADLPTRDSDGNVRQRPRAALELHYLLTFHGDEGQLEPQRVLGSVVRSLHEHPLLTRQMIQDTLAAPTFNYLATSNLADQVERVKFTPTALSLEEFSKLWSVFFQIPYTLSVAYQGSVVLIDGDEIPRPVLPVRERSVRVLPFQRPFIEEIWAEPKPTPPQPPNPIEAGGILGIQGQNLQAEVVRVDFSGVQVAPSTITSHNLQAVLPAGLLAGVNTLQVMQYLVFKAGAPSEPHRAFESNVAAFILAPKLVVKQPAPPEPVLGNVQRGSNLVLNVAPAIERSQDVRLLLDAPPSAGGVQNVRGPVADRTIALPPRLSTDPPLTTSLAFPIPADFPTGEFLVRVQVNGAQSQLVWDDISGFTGPRVVIFGGSHSLHAVDITLNPMASDAPTLVFYGMTAAVTLEDETAAVVPGAQVGATWTLPDGTTQDDTQPTRNNGVASFTIPGPIGIYLLEITTIAKQGYVFDQHRSALSRSNHLLRSVNIAFPATAPSAIAEISVRDDTSALIPAAQVSVTWTLVGGTTSSDTQPTDDKGVARFNTPGGSGEYTLAISNITKPNYAFDPPHSMLTANFTKA